MSPGEQLRLDDYLAHIRDAIGRCRRYIEDMDEAAFLQDEKTQDAVVRTFEVIGEASNNVTKRFPQFAAQHPEIPWGKTIGMRNVLAHGYFQVDLGAVWKTIHSDLPDLARGIDELIGRLDVEGNRQL